MITFQELIRRLTDFWEKQGCVIHQGYDLEMGAGTFNPATFLRSLGPESYAAAYVEPSRRPTDGRYGENPNRFQRFHQYQVIIKPSPSDIQQTYLKSLESVGLNLKEHDIRFVHDDWEAPTQGAWGLGWEVWIDGMEATQYTYFQMVGSQPLKPISVELTYGLERLAMFLQGVDHFLDLKWNEQLTFRDIVYEQEIEWSTYNFKEASTEMWHRHFNDYEKEAKDLIARNLPLPAYDFVIKASHAFNILEARGVISVTERIGYITRIRDLSRLIASAYISSRESLGFPLASAKGGAKPAKPPSLPKKFDPKKREDFLLEIGSEELPATFVPIGCRNLESKMRTFLDKAGLAYEETCVYATPRRLAILVHGLVGGTEAKEIKKRGPKLETAFGSDGILTPQGKGFFKSIGHEEATRDSFEKGAIPGLTQESDYLFFSSTTTGKSTLALLAENLSQLILEIDFPKKMRWGDLDISYPRPLHWIVALYGKEEVPFRIGNVVSGSHTYGHAQRGRVEIALSHPDDYLKKLKKQSVLADIEERKESILSQLSKIEKKYQASAVAKERVLKEVLYLGEWPELTVADFDPKFLQVPKHVLVSEMVSHQRYFPLEDGKGHLKNLFVITADNTPTDLIRKGNQKVLSARLSDGVFLFKEDLKEPLENFNDMLKAMTFQKDLGSVFDKVVRLTAHAKSINDALALADDVKLARATLLCKSDLASALVKEFPELQGEIGATYATIQKEDPEVATAIAEHWLPINEGGKLPETPVGIVLSLANKIDNLLGYFSVDLKPTSSSDPYALRRQAIGLIKILLNEKISVAIPTLLHTCSKHFSFAITEPLIQEIVLFLTARSKGIFEELGFDKGTIAACLTPHLIDPFDQLCRIQALSELRGKKESFSHLAEVFKRVKGLLETRIDAPFSPDLMKEPAEKELLKALAHLEKHWSEALAERNYLRAFELMADLQQPLAHLLDSVKILCDDEATKHNRIALLQSIFARFEALVDFSKLQG